MTSRAARSRFAGTVMADRVLWPGVLGVKLGQVEGYSGEAGGGLKLGEIFGLKVAMIASHSGS